MEVRISRLVQWHASERFRPRSRWIPAKVPDDLERHLIEPRGPRYGQHHAEDDRLGVGRNGTDEFARLPCSWDERLVIGPAEAPLTASITALATSTGGERGLRPIDAEPQACIVSREGWAAGAAANPGRIDEHRCAHPHDLASVGFGSDEPHQVAERTSLALEAFPGLPRKFEAGGTKSCRTPAVPGCWRSSRVVDNRPPPGLREAPP